MKLFVNGHFWQNGGFDDTVFGVLTKDGKISEILRSESATGADIPRVDLAGAYVFPGFIDTHTHSFEGGLYSLMIDLSEAKNLDDVFGMISEGSKTKGKLVFAWNFDETRIAEKRFPTRAELDQVVPNQNLVLRRIDGHSCIVNTFACDSILGANKKIHCEDDILKGFENDKAVHWFHNNLDNEMVLKAYHAASAIALKGGFTTIHTMVGDANMSIGHYAMLKDQLSSFPLDFVLYPQSFNIEAALELGAKRIGGCILADGSIGSFTAALYEPYAGKPIRGNLYQTDSFWHDFISKAHSHDLQVAVHCIGDRAISQINNVYHDLNNKDPKDLRHQLIHCEITDDLLLQQIQESKAVPVMQPMFDHLWGGPNRLYAKLLGTERAGIMNRFRSMTDMGIRITGSSDWYITELDIRKSLSAAMSHHIPAERLNLAQAVGIYTSNAAWLSHDENIRGSISPGLDADFCALNYIPQAAMPQPGDKITKVVKRAEIVYEDISH